MTAYLTHPGDEYALVQRILATPELRSLVEMDGGVWPIGPPADQLAYLEEFSARWDKRGGDLRLVFHDVDESRTDSRAALVYTAARALGMLSPERPIVTEPDFVLILGGLATGVEPRVRYAAELIHSGEVKCNHVVALGSYRPVDDRERAAADRFAPEARHELDLLAAMLGQVFDGPSDWRAETDGDPIADPRLAQTKLSSGGIPELTVLAARSGDPTQRPANTADTYEQFLADASADSGNGPLLVVTSSIYLPYQHLDAVRILSARSGRPIETVGVPGSSNGPAHPPSSYLQEIRSLIRSARGLAESISSSPATQET